MATRKLQSKTGMLHTFLVFYKGEKVGTGYVVIWGGNMSEPLLFSDDGDDLPRNNWYNLVMTGEEHLVVINETIQ